MLYGEAGRKILHRISLLFSGAKNFSTGLDALIDDLISTGQLENTVIAIYGDHYPYGLTKTATKELFGDLENEYEINKVPFIILDIGYRKSSCNK